MHLAFRVVLVAFSSVVFAGCANLSAGNLFSHYSAQNAKVYQELQAGEYQRAQDALNDSVGGEILDNFEKGRVSFLNKDYQGSFDYLSQSDQAVRQQQDLAVISVSESLTSVGALAINDNLSTYYPADYELGFLHLYLGLNYLKNNDLQGALIEMRRANQVQEKAKKEREESLAAAEEELKISGIAPNMGSVLSNYPDAGKTLQAVQNGYLLYLSALLYETDGDLNAAYVDYRRALAVSPNNAEVIDGTMRVARRLGMQEDLAKLQSRYGESKAISGGDAKVIVLEEQGVVEALQGWKVSLPVYDSQGNSALYSLALPYYRNTTHVPYSSLFLNGEALVSDKLVDVDLMAQQGLSERMPSMVVRQVLRVVAKDRIRKETANKEENVGNLLFNVWNTLTEQPDTRSWQTLPRVALSASSIVNSGVQTLIVDGQEYQFNVTEGRTALVWISRQGGNATIWHKQLGRL